MLSKYKKKFMKVCIRKWMNKKKIDRRELKGSFGNLSP